MLISRTRLLQLLERNNEVISHDLEWSPVAADGHDLIRLTIEARLRRCGGEVRLVVPPHSSTNVTARRPLPSLVKAVARAHGWYQRVLQGKALDQRSLARHAGLTERYVGKVFACAFLAPDIVEAILQGQQPPI